MACSHHDTSPGLCTYCFPPEISTKKLHNNDDYLDIEWSDPLAVQEAWSIAKARGGKLNYEYDLESKSMVIAVTVPGPLRYRMDGKINRVADFDSVTINFNFKIEHSYNVKPEQQVVWTQFIDRRPERANYPESMRRYE